LGQRQLLVSLSKKKEKRSDSKEEKYSPLNQNFYGGGAVPFCSDEKGDALGRIIGVACGQKRRGGLKAGYVRVKRQEAG